MTQLKSALLSCPQQNSLDHHSRAQCPHPPRQTRSPLPDGCGPQTSSHQQSAKSRSGQPRIPALRRSPESAPSSRFALVGSSASFLQRSSLLGHGVKGSEYASRAWPSGDVVRYIHAVLHSAVTVKTRIAVTLSAAAIVLMSGCADNRNTSGHSGVVTGRILTAPTCPVQRVGQECPPRPVPGSAVVAVEGAAIRASTHTDSAGTFHLTLPYGRYVITATNVGGYPSTAAENVYVSGAPVQITLFLDSGIR